MDYMANSARGEATMWIGGQTRHFVWEMEHIAQLEEWMDKGIGEIMSGRQLGIRTTGAMLAAGQLHKNPRITPAVCIKWLKDEIRGQHPKTRQQAQLDSGDVLLICLLGLAAAMPARKEEEAAPEGDGQNPTTAPTTAQTTTSPQGA